MHHNHALHYSVDSLTEVCVYRV